MKKNLGNGIVKKSIVLAMSVMLVSASPLMNAAAAEDIQTVTVDQVLSDSGLNDVSNGVTDVVDTIDNDLQQAIDDTNKAIDDADFLSNEEKDLAKDICTGLLEVGDKQATLDPSVYDAYDVVDDAHNVVKKEVDEALDKEVTDANQAADDAEDAAEDAKELAENVKEYEDVTDELLNDDEEMVENVDGNTDDIVETITVDGDILLNVEDENGDMTQVKVEDYTQKQADIATGAVDVANESLNNILNNSNANIADERAKLDEAVATAEAAKTEAETAYNAANSVLLDQIKRYNAYATKYGLDLYEYTDENGEASTPAYTEDELAGLSNLTMNKDVINSELTELNEEDLSAQLDEIKAAERLVGTCADSVVVATEAVAAIKSTEENMVAGLESMMEEALKAKEATTSWWQQQALEAIYQSSKALLDEYRKPLDQTHPDGLVDNYENRFDYAIGSATNLTEQVDQLVQDANDELYGTEDKVGAVTRYNNALEEYNKIKAEYDNYLANKDAIDANFTAIEAKLAEAEKAVDEAHKDLVIAVEAVNNANNVKAKFEDVVANMNDDSDSSSSDSGSSDSGSSSSSSNATTTSTAAATLTVEDVIVPLTATILDEQVPMAEMVTIVDDAAPLADAVPKTGDASAAAGAVGASGVIAMLGALFMNFKKRTLR